MALTPGRGWATAGKRGPFIMVVEETAERGGGPPGRGLRRKNRIAANPGPLHYCPGRET